MRPVRPPGGLQLPDTPLTSGGRGTPGAPAPVLRPAPGRPGGEGVGGGGDAPPPARGLARAHPSRPGRAAGGLAGPRGCSWALLETSNAGSDSSPTARMQEPPLPPPLHPTPPPSAEPERRGRASERESQRASERETGRAAACLSRPRTRRTDGPKAKCGEGPGARCGGAEVRPSAGRRQAGALGPNSTRTLTHTYSQLTRGRGDKDTHGAQETRGAHTLARGRVQKGEGGAGRSRSTKTAWGTFPEAARGQRVSAPTH